MTDSESESDGFCTRNLHPTDSDIGWLHHIPIKHDRSSWMKKSICQILSPWHRLRKIRLYGQIFLSQSPWGMWCKHSSSKFQMDHHRDWGIIAYDGPFGIYPGPTSGLTTRPQEDKKIKESPRRHFQYAGDWSLLNFKNLYRTETVFSWFAYLLNLLHN